MQRVSGICSFFRGLFHCVKPLLYSGTNAVGKKIMNTGLNIITDLLNKQPDQQVRDTFQPIVWEVKNNLKHKIKIMTGNGLCLKRKCNLKKAHSLSKPRKMKHIFTQ